MRVLMTNAEALEKYGIILDQSSLTICLEVVFSAVFFYALFRALYQWFAGNGIQFPSWVGKCLLIKEVLPGGDYLAPRKQGRFRELKTFLIVFSVAFASRALIAYLGYLYKVTQAVRDGYASYDLISSFSNIWNRWDAPHYVDIAKNWYVTEAQAQAMGNDSYLFIVFFPLLPMLMRLFSPFAPDAAIAGMQAVNQYYFFVGCFISTVCFSVAAYYLFKLVRREYNMRTAVWTLVFLLLTPAGFFFFNAYTDSLLLMCSVIFFYQLRCGRYWLAALFGMLAALSRSLGVILAVPFFVEWIDQERVISAWKREPLAPKLRKLLPVLLLPLGTLCYLFINYSVFQDPLRFLLYQKNHWGQSFSWFLSNLSQIGSRIFFTDQKTAWAIWLPGFLAIAAAIFAFLFGSGKKLRAGYLAYMMIYIVFAAAPSWLLSGARYFAVLFPVYILLARRAEKTPWLGVLAAAVMAVGLTAMTVMFISGWQVM